MFKTHSMTTSTWSDVVSRYEDWSGLEQMAVFANQVANSDFASRIYPYTSMDCIGVAQTETILEDQERFLIVFDTERKEFRLAYSDQVRWDSTDEPPKMRGEDSWYRECTPQNVFDSFRKFLEQVHWI